MLGEGVLDGLHVVVRQHQGVGGAGTGHARGVGQGEGRQTRTGGGQERVHVAVVVARELDDLAPPGEPARETDRGHGRLGPGVDQTNLLHRGALDDQLGEFDLARRRRPVGGPGRDLAVEGLHHGGLGVPEDERTPGADEVDVATTVGVREVGALSLDEERRGAADGTEGADGRVHAAGDDGGRPLEELCGSLLCTHLTSVSAILPVPSMPHPEDLVTMPLPTRPGLSISKESPHEPVHLRAGILARWEALRPVEGVLKAVREVVESCPPLGPSGQKRLEGLLGLGTGHEGRTSIGEVQQKPGLEGGGRGGRLDTFLSRPVTEHGAIVPIGIEDRPDLGVVVSVRLPRGTDHPLALRMFRPLDVHRVDPNLRMPAHRVEVALLRLPLTDDQIGPSLLAARGTTPEIALPPPSGSSAHSVTSSTPSSPSATLRTRALWNSSSSTSGTAP